MTMPVRVIMDDLHAITTALRDEGRFGEALIVESLEEAANRAGHSEYTWDGIAKQVRSALATLESYGAPIDGDVLELVDAALSKPKGMP